jgi:hypothetical protein
MLTGEDSPAEWEFREQQRQVLLMSTIASLWDELEVIQSRLLQAWEEQAEHLAGEPQSLTEEG